MSIFRCADCDNIRDADDGCDEAAPGSNDLICTRCMEAREVEAEEIASFHAANPLEPDFRRIA